MNDSIEFKRPEVLCGFSVKPNKSRLEMNTFRTIGKFFDILKSNKYAALGQADDPT